MLPRLLALFLILTMVCSPSVISVIADSLNPGGTSESIKQSVNEQGAVKAPATAIGEPTNVGATNSDGPKDPNCDGYEVQGILLRLQQIPNIATHDFTQEYMEQTKHDFHS